MVEEAHEDDGSIPAPEGGPGRDPEGAGKPEEAEMHAVEKSHVLEGKVSLGRLALEAAMIAFGVLLALSAESWHEHGRQQDLAHEALDDIHDEMAYDVQRIRQQLPAQRELAEALKAFIAGRDAGRRPPAPTLALHPPLLTTAAWDTALSTQALAHVGFKTVHSLAQFYEGKRWLSRIEDGWIRLSTEPLEGTGDFDGPRATSTLTLLYTYIEIENALLVKAREAAPQASAD